MVKRQALGQLRPIQTNARENPPAQTKRARNAGNTSSGDCSFFSEHEVSSLSSQSRGSSAITGRKVAATQGRLRTIAPTREPRQPRAPKPQVHPPSSTHAHHPDPNNDPEQRLVVLENETPVLSNVTRSDHTAQSQHPIHFVRNKQAAARAAKAEEEHRAVLKQLYLKRQEPKTPCTPPEEVELHQHPGPSAERLRMEARVARKKKAIKKMTEERQTRRRIYWQKGIEKANRERENMFQRLQQQRQSQEERIDRKQHTENVRATPSMASNRHIIYQVTNDIFSPREEESSSEEESPVAASKLSAHSYIGSNVATASRVQGQTVRKSAKRTTYQETRKAQPKRKSSSREAAQEFSSTFLLSAGTNSDESSHHAESTVSSPQGGDRGHVKDNVRAATGVDQLVTKASHPSTTKPSFAEALINDPMMCEATDLGAQEVTEKLAPNPSKVYVLSDQQELAETKENVSSFQVNDSSSTVSSSTTVKTLTEERLKRYRETPAENPVLLNLMLQSDSMPLGERTSSTDRFIGLEFELKEAEMDMVSDLSIGSLSQASSEEIDDRAEQPLSSRDLRPDDFRTPTETSNIAMVAEHNDCRNKSEAAYMPKEAGATQLGEIRMQYFHAETPDQPRQSQHLETKETHTSSMPPHILTSHPPKLRRLSSNPGLSPHDAVTPYVLPSSLGRTAKTSSPGDIGQRRGHTSTQMIEGKTETNESDNLVEKESPPDNLELPATLDTLLKWNIANSFPYLTKFVFQLMNGQWFEHPPLPPGWQLAVSRTTNRPFYYHQYSCPTYCPPQNMEPSGVYDIRTVFVPFGTRPKLEIVSPPVDLSGRSSFQQPLNSRSSNGGKASITASQDVASPSASLSILATQQDHQDQPSTSSETSRMNEYTNGDGPVAKDHRPESQTLTFQEVTLERKQSTGGQDTVETPNKARTDPQTEAHFGKGTEDECNVLGRVTESCESDDKSSSCQKTNNSLDDSPMSENDEFFANLDFDSDDEVILSPEEKLAATPDNSSRSKHDPDEYTADGRALSLEKHSDPETEYTPGGLALPLEKDSDPETEDTPDGQAWPLEKDSDPETEECDSDTKGTEQLDLQSSGDHQHCSSINPRPFDDIRFSRRKYNFHSKYYHDRYFDVLAIIGCPNDIDHFSDGVSSIDDCGASTAIRRGEKSRVMSRHGNDRSRAMRQDDSGGGLSRISTESHIRFLQRRRHLQDIAHPVDCLQRLDRLVTDLGTCRDSKSQGVSEKERKPKKKKKKKSRDKRGRDVDSDIPEFIIILR